MKTIITAIDNPKIFNEIKKNKNIKIIGKDLIYKEAVLELLEKNKNIDLIILYEKILGEINFFELIKKIKNINKKIKIIIIIENKNEKLENKLKKINIKNIYLKNKINSKKIIEIINEKNINKNNKNKKTEKNNKKINKKEKNKFIKIKKKRRKEKIVNIKKYFFQSLKEIKNKFFLLKKYIQNFINKFFRSKFSEMKEIKFKTTSKHNEKKKNETILILGNEKSGKTLVSLLVAQKLKNQNKKISIINLSNNTKNRKKYNKVWYIQKEIEDQLKNYNNKKSILNFLKKLKFKNKQIDKTKNKNIKKLKKEINKKEKNKIEKIKKLNNNKLKNNKKVKNIKKIKIKLNKNKILKKYKLKINKKNINKTNKFLKYKKIEKNKIEKEKIVKRIKNYLSKKIDGNINYYSNFNFIKKYEKANCKNFKEKTISIILKIIKEIQNESRYTIIELNASEYTKLTNEIIKNTDKIIIIIIIEANYLGIKSGHEIIERFKEEEYLEKSGLHIVFNKIEKSKIGNKILEEIFKDYKILGNIMFDESFLKISFNSLLKNKNKVNLRI